MRTAVDMDSPDLKAIFEELRTANLIAYEMALYSLGNTYEMATVARRLGLPQGSRRRRQNPRAESA